MFENIVRIGTTASLVALAVAAGVTPAHAAARDGRCDDGEFCLYYNSSQQGSLSDFTGSISDYGSNTATCYVFKGPGSGRDECVKNNAASVWNRTTKPVTVFYNSGFGGAKQVVAPGSKANLSSALKNQNASHSIGTTLTPLSYALYNRSGGYVSCPYDGYKETLGRHEGIDIRRSIGTPVLALVEGEVVGLVQGRRGRASNADISTIAVYNASLKKTVVYLHLAPAVGLAKGQKVSKGQQIGVEDWRGVTSKSSFHTHVEMRIGWKANAAKSVDDPDLTNPNPTAFWRDRGYSIG